MHAMLIWFGQDSDEEEMREVHRVLILILFMKVRLVIHVTEFRPYNA